METKPRLALLIAATQRYTALIPAVQASVEQFFLKDCEVELIVLTDRPEQVKARTLRIEHRPWPWVAMHKFHFICRYARELAEFDYVFMCDADMRIVAPVGREVLGDLVGTQHAYFFDRPPAEFIYERNPASTAYIAPGEGRTYLQTAFFGGRYQQMLAMASDRRDAIEADYARGLVALWHDESHYNRYVYDHPDTLILPPSYCYPEGKDFPFEPRILALDKDHAVIRSTGWQTWLIRGERLAGRVARKAQRALRAS